MHLTPELGKLSILMLACDSKPLSKKKKKKTKETDNKMPINTGKDIHHQPLSKCMLKHNENHIYSLE